MPSLIFLRLGNCWCSFGFPFLFRGGGLCCRLSYCIFHCLASRCVFPFFGAFPFHVSFSSYNFGVRSVAEFEVFFFLNFPVRENLPLGDVLI